MISSEPVAVEVADEILAHVANRIGFIELNRPRVLNALSLSMIRAMRERLDAWRHDANVLAVVVYSSQPRAFCAGGDLRYFYEVSRRGDLVARDRYFIEEYWLDHAIFVYPKPYIALMNGIVMGGGMGISLGAHRTGGLRVVTSTTEMAMPETRVGFFPDVGASWFLARTPGAIGRYLAVTGVIIDGGDALYAGLADRCMSAAAIPALLEALHRTPFLSGDDVVACVRRAADAAPCKPIERGGETSLAATREWIDRHFGQPDVARILTSLESEQSGEAYEWARDTIGMLRERSPLSMAVSLEVVARGGSPMAQCMQRDLDLTRSTFELGDVMEGVRARMIDKDNRPRWRIPRIEDVTLMDVEKMFVSPWSAEEHPLRELSI